MRKISNKQKKEKRLLSIIYNQIAEERGHYCTGCGRSDVPLSHSHLIPRSYNKSLVTDKRNITYHCFSLGEHKGCHDMWESKERVKLLDYCKNMEYILDVDTEYYFLITE